MTYIDALLHNYLLLQLNPDKTFNEVSKNKNFNNREHLQQLALKDVKELQDHNEHLYKQLAELTNNINNFRYYLNKLTV